QFLRLRQHMGGERKFRARPQPGRRLLGQERPPRVRNLYVHRGVVRKYRPDFLIRLTGGNMLVLETKGRDSEQDQTKRRFLAEWVDAVNSHGGFGSWSWDV